MNILPEVAEMLGIEFDVPFKIKGFSGELVLNNHGMSHGDKEKYWLDRHSFYEVLSRLVIGDFVLAVKPWKPAEGERYYFIDINAVIICTCFSQKISILDRLNYKIGNCFKTEVEAKRNKERILNIINSDKMLVEQEDKL